MAIIAESTGTKRREPLEAGNYVGRCFQMIHIGTIEETYEGQETKKANKVRIGWELPDELFSYKEGEPEKPITLFKEYTLSMHDKSGLRKMLKGWRGKDFTPEEARAFDITKLLGVACLINVVQKPSKDGTRIYEEIAGITPMMKGQKAPEQINQTQELNYDQFNEELFNSLPDYVQDKIKSSLEYMEWLKSKEWPTNNVGSSSPDDDLPF